MDSHLGPAETAKRFGISIKALRLYEQRGLLKPLRGECAVVPDSPGSKIQRDDGRCTVRSGRFTETGGVCLRPKGSGEFAGARR